MDVVWNRVFRWVDAMVEVDPVWAKISASLACSLAVCGMAFVLFGAVSFFGRKFLLKTASSKDKAKTVSSFVSRMSWLVFAWALYAYLPDVFGWTAAVARPLSRFLNIIVVVACALMLSAAVSYMRMAGKSRTQSQVFESKTLSQVLKILIWFTAAIVIVSVLMGKSPAFVLSGLGALTAVLMLIFRDSLLGLVAGVQVSQNDMVRIGDWITMPKYNADGNGIDIALTTVKVRNFDNTVTMIPSSALISDAFVNWRYMSTSKGRRIKRPVWVSVTSIRELTPELRESLVSQGLLKAEDNPVSNLAAFETWLERMLAADEDISCELTCMVRQTEAGDTGIPVEVYAFTKTRDWVEYEKIQTGIFDRIFVTLPKFGLQVYQRTGDKILV
jgi:miniconductance mechanosensitive channel